MTQGPRARLMASAIALVRERGVEATGLTELTEHSGAARRSIYQHFPGGKLELIEASTRAAGRWMSRALAATGAESPSEMVARIIGMTSATVVAHDYRRGCPIAGAALAPPEAAGVRAAAADVFEAWTSELAAALGAAGASTGHARSLAGFAVSSIEGALMRANVARSTEPLDQVAEQLVPMLDEATRPGRVRSARRKGL